MKRALGHVFSWLESQSPEQLESDSITLPVRFAEEMGLSEKEVILLEEMLRLFNEKKYYKMFFLELKIATHLMSKPDTEIYDIKELSKNSLTMFDEFPSVRFVTNKLLKLVKNRYRSHQKSQNQPKYRTIIENAFNKQKEDEGNFSIEPKDQQRMHKRFVKRAKTKHNYIDNNRTFPDKGRIIRYSEDKKGSIAISPTIFKAIKQGNYSLEHRKFEFSTWNFLYPQYEQNVIYNMILVLDTSKSIVWMISSIEEIISHITSNAFHSRDRLGLITFQNNRAFLHHYPTLNVKQVIGTINKIEAKGETPLGEGLNLALQVFSKEQYRLPGMKNIIIMISDCFPEPLEGRHKNLLDEPCYKAVVSASEKIKKAKIDLIIINPSAQEYKKGWNLSLINKIKEVSDASYIRIHPKIQYNRESEAEASISLEDSLYLSETIWSVKTGFE